MELIPRADAEWIAVLQQSSVMWARFVKELRRLGPRKLAIIAVVVAIAVVLAYGNNSTDDVASGRTLPKAALTSHPHPHVAPREP